MCYGPLRMKTQEIENSCVCELVAMMDGYNMRFLALDDLLVARCAIPAYQAGYGRKAPSYKELTRGRKKGDAFTDLTHEELLALASE